MESRLLFIIPALIAVTGILFLLGLKFSLPKWLSVSLGGLQADDMRKLTPEHVKDLKRNALFGFPPAIIIMVLVGLGFTFFGFLGGIITALICIAIQFVISAIALNPLYKTAKEIKEELDLATKQDRL
jgi:MFS family permease